MLFLTTAPAPDTATWIGGFLTVAVMVGLIFNAASYFATRREMVAHEQRLSNHIAETKTVTDQLFSKVGGVERGLRHDLTKSEGFLHDKVNDVARTVSKMEGQVDLINQNVKSIDAKIDRAIERHA